MTLTPEDVRSQVCEPMSSQWRPLFEVDVRAILGPLRRGAGDPCHHIGTDGDTWRTSRLPTGPVSYRIWQSGLRNIHCQAWGPGAAELLDTLPTVLGAGDSPEDFDPHHPALPDQRLLADAVRRFPGLRMSRTSRVLEALVPAIIEQKITGNEARQSWRTLVRRHGEPAPGPTPVPMWLPPTAEAWRLIPSWEWHRAGVDPARSGTVMRALRVIGRLEQCSTLPPAQAQARLRAVPGIGVWTAAETAQRALGDADALSVGDYHIAAFVGWSLLGRPIDDAGMVELLEPWRGHRHRVVRLLEMHPAAVKPRFGARMTIQDHRGH